MNFKTYLSQLNQFFDLVQEESTGPVKNLSELFGVSEYSKKNGKRRWNTQRGSIKVL